MVWINLLKAAHKKPDFLRYQEIYQKVVETSESGKHIYRLSMCHLNESMKRNNLDSRNDLLLFIFTTTKFNSIFPWVYILDLEVRNAILKILEKHETDLSKIVFGRGVDHCLGAKGKIISKSSKPIPEEIYEKLYSALIDPVKMADALSKIGMEERISDGIKRDEELAKVLEELRKKEYAHKDKTKRQNIAHFNFIIHMLRDRFIIQSQILGLTNSQIKSLIITYFTTREKLFDFLKLIPTLYVFFVLNHARNLNKSRPIDSHDIYDLGALSIAIPYCDVVVTERQWAQILNEKGLDKLYNTRIIYKLDDLNSIL